MDIYSNYAYITCLTSKKYIPGLRALKRSLKKAKSKFNLYVLIPDDMKELKDILLVEKIIDDYCGYIYSKNIKIKCSDSIRNYYWYNTFFKLKAADLPFKKIILLDLDMLVLKNIDHLFDKPHYSAVAAGNCVFQDWVYLNSGLMVLEPSKQLFKKLLNCIEPAIKRRQFMNLNVGDQDVFEQAYQNWENHKNLSLPEIYNALFHILKEVRKNVGKNIYVVHFVGEIKPWETTLKSITKEILKLLKSIELFKLYIYCKYLFYCKFK